MNKEFRVGLMFLIAAAIMIATVYYVGNFQDRVTYRVRFEKVSGLTVDSPVHFNGVPIGRVRKIVLEEEPENLAKADVVVTIEVHRSARAHVRQSTRADIKSIGILGDKYVLLVTSNYSSPELEPDAFIPTVANKLNVDELLQQGTDVVADVSQITEDLKSVLNDLAKGEGTLQMLIRNKDLSDELDGALRQSLAEIRAGQSLAGLVLNNRAFAEDVRKTVENITADWEEIVEPLKSGDGIAPMLMADAEFRDQVRDKVNRLLDELQAAATNFNESRGLYYKMTQDEEYAERVADNIEKSTYHLASILEKLDEGQGSAGLLINDPTLYQGLYEVVYGVQHSGITKWFVQRKRRQGQKELEKDGVPEDPPALQPYQEEYP